jgi:DNA-directed RNA polymerase specialized sigma24 family protein
MALNGLSRWSREKRALEQLITRAVSDAGHDVDSASRDERSFEAFVIDAEPRLRRALVAAYGFEEGRDAAAEALAYAWEHWARLKEVGNLPGYLFRVAQSSRRSRRPPVLFDSSGWAEHLVEPGLPGALATLSRSQRVAVVLVYGYGYTLREVSELTGVRKTTVQTHVERGLARLRVKLGVNDGD